MGYANSLNNNIKICGCEEKHRANKKKNYHLCFKDKPNDEGIVINTLEYAIAWGVREKPYNKSQLMQLCKAKDAPSFAYLMRTFVTYERYYKALVKAGMPERPLWREQERSKELIEEREKAERLSFFAKDVDAARMAAQYGIVNRNQYRQLRIKDNEARKLLPPENVIRKVYGSFQRFMVEIMKYNADATITKYVELSRSKGRWLTLRECDSNKLPIRGIMDLLRPSVFNLLCYHKMRTMYPDFGKNAAKE